jgi:molybdenum transport protein
MQHSGSVLTAEDLSLLLREDAPYGDLTTRSLDIGGQPARLAFTARDPMVACGIEEAAGLFELAGAEQVAVPASSGDQANPGSPLLLASGPADALFLAWKVAQSLVESLSGVASCTRALVERADGVVVACTRKHLPGTKRLMIKAVKAGGGIMHRLGISESLMVTAEHRLFLSGDREHSYLAQISRQQPEKKCVVEVDNLADALSLIRQACDVIQLEKLAVSEVADVVAAAAASGPDRPVIAAAGGINLDNVAEYAATGIDLLVTSAPYFAKPRDVQVTFETA